MKVVCEPTPCRTDLNNQRGFAQRHKHQTTHYSCMPASSNLTLTFVNKNVKMTHLRAPTKILSRQKAKNSNQNFITKLLHDKLREYKLKTETGYRYHQEVCAAMFVYVM